MSESNNNARVEYMRTTGFALFTDVGSCALESIEHQPFDRAESLTYDARSTSPLFMATNAIFKSTDLRPNRDPEKFAKMYGANNADFDAQDGLSIFQNGFSDRAFQWAFPSAIASCVADSFVVNGSILKEQRSKLTLSDWADMIGSNWFSKLIHSMAFTGNTVYTTFGDSHEHHSLTALESKMAEIGLALTDDVFTTQTQLDRHDNKTYLTAKLSPTCRTVLRQQMAIKDGKGATGCPVARRVAYLPDRMITNDNHIKRLLDHEILSIEKTCPNNKVKVTQEYSVIDRSLIVFANRLEAYDTRYGTPTAYNCDGSEPQITRGNIPHKKMPKTEALIIG